MATIRLSVQHGVPELLIYCFAHLDDKLKPRLSEFVEGPILHKVINAMITEGLFPEWFGDALEYDPLYGRFVNLRWALSIAEVNLLITRQYPSLAYRLIDFGSVELMEIIRSIGMRELDAKRIALELNKRLLALGAG